MNFYIRGRIRLIGCPGKKRLLLPSKCCQPARCSEARRFLSFKPEAHRDNEASVPLKRQVVPVTKNTPSSSSSKVYSQKSVDATKLVDDLLEYTLTLMGNDEQYIRHIIAYSGGIDSSLVAALVHQVGTNNTEKLQQSSDVRAVLGLSPAVPSEQVLLAEQVANHIGITLEQILTTEGTDDVYIENAGQACLACKTHLYTCLESIVEHVDVNSKIRLYNGTNADDLLDPTRLGLIAADKHNVQSPLRYTTKDNVRLAGKHLGLPNWNYAASPCLRSRLAIGVEAVPQHLERIEKAERHVRQSLNLDATRNLRVRLLSRNRAMIEVQVEDLETAQSWMDSWQSFFCNELDFESINLRQFKSGSVAPKVVSIDDDEEEGTPQAAIG